MSTYRTDSSFQVVQLATERAKEEDEEGSQTGTYRLDHGVPQVLDGLLVLDNLGGTRDRGPVGAVRVREGDVDVRVVLELVKLAGCAATNAVSSRQFKRTWFIGKTEKKSGTHSRCWR